MSSSVHAKCNTVDRESVIEAAKQLGVKLTENEKKELVYKGTVIKFDEKGQMDVRYYKDHVEENRTTKQLTQLGTYFTTKKRMKSAGLECTTDVKDALLAVKANQKLTLEFIEVAG